MNVTKINLLGLTVTLYYYGVRWYDTALGRFVQADTVTPDGVQGFDRYAYANNNPLKYIDPSGDEDVEHTCYSPTDPGCYNIIVPPGGEYERVYIGGSSGIAPNTQYASYGQEAEETYCQDCLDDPKGLSQAAGLTSDVLTGIQNGLANHGKTRVFLYLDLIKDRSGNVSVNSISVKNTLSTPVSVQKVKFDLELEYRPDCGVNGCEISLLSSYAADRTVIGVKDSGLGVIERNSTRSISLTNGPYNPTNTFPSYYQVNITVNLASFSYSTGPINLTPIYNPLQ